MNEIFGLWLIWAVGYTMVFLYKSSCGLLWDKPEILWDATNLSFTNIFAFFGFDRRLPNFMIYEESHLFIALAGLETILGFILVFFLGLGLRNRFRLK